MKKYQSHLYVFSKELLGYIPNMSSFDVKAYILVLICIYTGVSIKILINKTYFNGEKLWVRIPARSGEIYTVSFGIPNEFFLVCNSKNIDYLSCIKKVASLRDVMGVLNKINSSACCKVSLEELQTIFRMLCESSSVTLMAYKSRVDLFEREGGLKFIPCDSKYDKSLNLISLIKLIKN